MREHEVVAFNVHLDFKGLKVLCHTVCSGLRDFPVWIVSLNHDPLSVKLESRWRDLCSLHEDALHSFDWVDPQLGDLGADWFGKSNDLNIAFITFSLGKISGSP